MIAARPPLRHYTSRSINAVAALFLAGAAGFFIATQRLDIVLLASAISVLAITVILTPLAAVMILLILAPMRTLIATEGAVQLPLDIGQLALIVLIGAWSIYRIVRGQRLVNPAVWSPLTAVLILYLVVIGFTAFGAASLLAWLNDWLKWVQILVMIAAAVTLAPGRGWEWLVAGLVLAGVANALIGIYQFFGGSGALHLLINDRFFRAFGTFGQPNPFGGFMGLLIPLSLMAALGYGFRLWKVWRATNHVHRIGLLLMLFYVISSGIMLIAIGMSWSRGAWLGLGGALAVVAFALPRKTRYGLLAFGLIFGILGGLWLAGLLPASILERLSTSTQEFFAFEDIRGVDITPENYAVAERLAHWQAALNMATHNPWLGVGVGNYEVAYPQYRLLNWDEPLGHAHNYYLNILAEGGIIGLLVYSKVWVVIITLSWRTRQHPDILARLVSIGLLGAWVYLLIHSLFDNLYVNNLFLHLGLMLGLLLIIFNQVGMYKRLAGI